MLLKACVVFDTRYGNTEKIAKSLQTGLTESGVQTLCVSARDVVIDSLKEFDLICVGAPTEWMTASKPMKEFLGKLKAAKLSGKCGFAFDTKLDRPLSGSAAKFIEKELRNMGIRVVVPRETATVFLVNGKVGDAYLKEGEVERFRQIGATVGRAVAEYDAAHQDQRL